MLTVLMVLAIGVGIGTSMTALSIYRAAAGDPIPAKSRELFVPQIDNCGPHCVQMADFGSNATVDGLPTMLSYRDAIALLRRSPAELKAPMYATVATVAAPNSETYPVQVTARATGADFFSMFQVPFRYGAPWSRREDQAHAEVVVLTRGLNDQLFAGRDSVGRVLRINDQDYRIVGVTERWSPVPRFYDLFAGTTGGDDAAFISFNRAVDLQLSVNSGITCRTAVPGDGWGQILASECTWVQFWVQLSTAAAVRQYSQYLSTYALDQRKSGRFSWPPRVQLRSVNQWLRYRSVVPPPIRVAVIVAFSLLIACLLNAMGLILARLLPRSVDISVRQALGATRGAVFVQTLVEVGTIGALGAIVGVILTVAGLSASRVLLPSDQLRLIRFDEHDFLVAVALSILSTVLAGLYPTWRASRIQPAVLLKVQ